MKLKRILKEKVFSYKKEFEKEKTSHTEFYYTFSTPENKYGVALRGEVKQYVEVEFFLDLDGDYSYDFTGEQVSFSVISTVVEIMENFWKEYNEDYQFKGFVFKGMSTDEEDVGELTKRTRIFKKVVESEFSNANVYVDNKKVYIEPS